MQNSGSKRLNDELAEKALCPHKLPLSVMFLLYNIIPCIVWFEICSMSRLKGRKYIQGFDFGVWLYIAELQPYTFRVYENNVLGKMQTESGKSEERLEEVSWWGPSLISFFRGAIRGKEWRRMRCCGHAARIRHLCTKLWWWNLAREDILGVTSIEFSVIIKSMLKNALIICLEMNVTQQHLYAATCQRGNVTSGFVTGRKISDQLCGLASRAALCWI